LELNIQFNYIGDEIILENFLNGSIKLIFAIHENEETIEEFLVEEWHHSINKMNSTTLYNYQINSYLTNENKIISFLDNSTPRFHIDSFLSFLNILLFKI
jgi:hypothetical protein